MNPDPPTILCGDFNTVFDRGLDRSGSDVNDSSRESTPSLIRLFDACMAVDIWRVLNPSSRSFSWLRPNGAAASRIDLVGLPVSWVPFAGSCDLLPCPFSDHCAVSLSVAVPQVLTRGPGVWKLNVSVLEEDDYVSLISSFWASWRVKKSDFVTVMDWWEVAKSKIKGLTVTYCKNRAERLRNRRDLLVRLVSHLKGRVDGGHSDCVGPYQAAVAQLKQLDLVDAEGARVRARVRWVEEGECSSSYFCKLEKKHRSESCITALRGLDNVVYTGAEGIQSVLSSFYADLFSKEDTDLTVQASLLSNVSDRVPADRVGDCEGPLSVAECFAALSGMARGKAPGIDGLPMEFYLKFWGVLGEELVEVLNFCHQAGFLAKSQRRGLITLTFKNGDRLDPRNWRPITLLYVDYKIASRAIAGCLLKVIHFVVAEDQTCGVPGRFIGDSVSLLRDVAHFASTSGSSVAILSLDQEKAFDRVDWSFLRSTLVCMGFGPSFISWVDLFYAGVQSAVKVNGFVTPFFGLSSGVRQGCPLSPLLYVLYAEVLACNIRSNPVITGLSLLGSPTPLPVLSQYADDTSVIVTSDAAIVATFATYRAFERGSGSKLNLGKCKGLWLGGWSGRDDPPLDLQWSSAWVKVLGVFIGPSDLEEENWRPRIAAVENCLKAWRLRRLSFRGRAVVVNALALSRIWYVASLIPIPVWVLASLNRLIFPFFWGGKADLVARDVVIQSLDFGGFSLVCVQLKVWALHVQWVGRFVRRFSAWMQFLFYYTRVLYGSTPGDLLSYPRRVDFSSLPLFYQAVLSAWVAVDGGFSAPADTLVVASSSVRTPVSAVSTKSTYSLLLEFHRREPACVVSFGRVFGPLYWPSTWAQLFWFSLDRPVIDVSWKIAHGVLRTGQRLVSTFGMSHIPIACFCNPLSTESLEHLFFSCPLAQAVLSWLQSLMSRCSALIPSLLCRQVLFGFNCDELRVVPRGFVYMLNVCKYFLWSARNYRFRDILPSSGTVCAQVCARVRFHLPLLFKRFRSSRRRRYFVRQWGARGVVASVLDGRLVVHL